MTPADRNARARNALRDLVDLGVLRSAWLPGMRARPRAGCHRGGIVWRTDGRAVCDLIDGDGNEARVGGPTVDTSDPVTALALLLLAREAWDEPTMSVQFTNGEWWCGSAFATERGHGATEVDAVIAALEARVAALRVARQP